MKVLITILTVFFLFCFIGWIIEVLYRSIRNKRFINPGFMVGCCLPIYGIGALMLYGVFKIDLGISNNIIEVIIKIVICSILLTLDEFIFGYISLKFYHNRLWDYSDRKFNIMGLICPTFSIVWTILAIVFYLVFYNNINELVDIIYTHQGLYLLLGMIIGVFLVDLGYSLKIMDKVRRYSKHIEEVINFEKLKSTVREKTTNGLKHIKSFSIFKVAHRVSAYLDQAYKNKDKDENNSNSEEFRD